MNIPDEPFSKYRRSSSFMYNGILNIFVILTTNDMDSCAQERHAMYTNR